MCDKQSMYDTCWNGKKEEYFIKGSHAATRIFACVQVYACIQSNIKIQHGGYNLYTCTSITWSATLHITVSYFFIFSGPTHIILNVHINTRSGKEMFHTSSMTFHGSNV